MRVGRIRESSYSKNFNVKRRNKTMDLKLRPASECKFDAVSLGEVMLRLDPGEGRIRTARQFTAWEGGGEYNVVRGLRRCFGLKTAVITAFADNEVGMLMEDFILQGGVDTSLIKWMKTDGIGRTCRNGLNFTERGFGIRGAVGCSDRANTAISKARLKTKQKPKLLSDNGPCYVSNELKTYLKDQFVNRQQKVDILDI